MAAKSLKRECIRYLTRHMDCAALRKMYHIYAYAVNWVNHGNPLFPRMMTIEINSHCNRACSYCPNFIAPQAARLIKPEVFRKIVDRIAEIDYAGVVDFIFFSEPTLHPKLAEYMAHLTERAPRCIPRISTNGDFLTETSVQRLLDAGINRIYAMRHLPTPEGWPERIARLSDRFPGLFVRMDIEQVETTVGLNHYGGLVKVRHLMKPETNSVGKAVCRVHAHLAQFTIDGDWDLCCTDFGKTYRFGNLLDQSIMEIWNQPAFVAIRRGLRDGRPPLPICKSCFCFCDRGAI